MRIFSIAALVAVSTAMEGDDTRTFTDATVNDTAFGEATSGEVSGTGSMGEWTRTFDDGELHAGLYIQFSTRCNGCMFANDAVVQTWVEMEDMDEPGTYNGMQCSANWEKSRDFAATYNVTSFKQTTPISANDMDWTRDGWTGAAP